MGGLYVSLKNTMRNDFQPVEKYLEKLETLATAAHGFNMKDWPESKREARDMYTLGREFETIYETGRDCAVWMSQALGGYYDVGQFPTIVDFVRSFDDTWVYQIDALEREVQTAKELAKSTNISWGMNELINLYEKQIKMLKVAAHTIMEISETDFYRAEDVENTLTPEVLKGGLIDIRCHNFEVAVSFAGEHRKFVEDTCNIVIGQLGENSVFYDNNYKSQLAVPSLDKVLKSIYHSRADLIVVFLSAEYNEKEWCGLEFHAIRDLLRSQNTDKIMYIRMNDGNVEGVYGIDGYIDGSSHTPEQIAKFILERVQLQKNETD